MGAQRCLVGFTVLAITKAGQIGSNRGTADEIRLQAHARPLDETS
jgi:hypothetical protein